MCHKPEETVSSKAMLTLHTDVDAPCSDLRVLPFACDLGRHVTRVIHTNITFAMATKVGPLAACARRAGMLFRPFVPCCVTPGRFILCSDNMIRGTRPLW